MVLHDTQVIAVHRVALGRPAEPKTSPETQKAACPVEECEGDSKCCEASETPRRTTTSKVTFKWEWNLGGVQLPRGQYIHDDLKFVSTGTDSPWAATQAATARAAMRAKGIDPALKVTGGVVAASSTASECCSTTASGASCCQGAEAGKVAVEVPEIGSQEIAGEWLIPNDGILLVSFGPHTVADKDGRAVVRERLAIIEAVESTELAGMPAPQPRNSVPGIVVPSLSAPVYFIRPAPLPRAAMSGTPPPPVPPVPGEAARVLSLPPGPVEMPMPPVPSRSIPQGYHMDGRAADLPPLPAEEDDDADSSESAEPRPSPQTRKSRQPEPAPETKARPKKSTGDPAMKKSAVHGPEPADDPQHVPVRPIDRLAVPPADQAGLLPAAVQPPARDRDLRPGRPQPRAEPQLGRAGRQARSRRGDHEVRQEDY